MQGQVVGSARELTGKGFMQESCGAAMSSPLNKNHALQRNTKLPYSVLKHLQGQAWIVLRIAEFNKGLAPRSGA
jgi:hypothetical protein